MIKKYWKELLLTTLLTLAPMLVGLAVWDRLPDMVATHFDLHNQPNGWSSKEMLVFGIPVFLAAMQGVLAFSVYADPKSRNIGGKGMKIVFWIIPVCSWIVLLSCYGIALGMDLNIGKVVTVFSGVLFVILGNYLPKNASNYSFGVRTPWALNDSENWNYTNRLAGYLFMAAGVVTIIGALVGFPQVLFYVLPVAAFVPCLASWLYYRKHDRDQN